MDFDNKSLELREEMSLRKESLQSRHACSRRAGRNTTFQHPAAPLLPISAHGRQIQLMTQAFFTSLWGPKLLSQGSAPGIAWSWGECVLSAPAKYRDQRKRTAWGD
jgi:hypothetical protein